MTREQLRNGAQPNNFQCPHSRERKSYCPFAVVQGSRLMCNKVNCALAVPERGWTQGFCFLVATDEYVDDIRNAIETGKIEKDDEKWIIAASNQRISEAHQETQPVL